MYLLACDNMSPRKETRKKILKASLELFSKKGYEPTTTKSIAEKADVNESTIFRHFDSKKNLFHVCIQEGLDVEEELIDVGLEPSDDLKEDLTEIGMKMGENMIDKSNLKKIMLMETKEHPEAFDKVSNVPFGALRLLIDYFEKAKKKGMVKDIDSEIAAVNFFSFFFRIMVANAFLGEDPFMELNGENIESFVNIFVEGIKDGD